MSSTTLPSHLTDNDKNIPTISTGHQIEIEDDFVLSQHCPDCASDFSIISSCETISPGSVDTIPTNRIMTAVDPVLHLQDVNFMLSAAVHDMSFEQMQAAFADLLRENFQLKADMLQSNVAMRKQFELMVSLHMHIKEFQKVQMKKHKRARAVIDQLWQENVKLCEYKSFGPVIEQLQFQLSALNLKYAHYEKEQEQENFDSYQLKEEMIPLRSDFLHLKSNYLLLLDEKRELKGIHTDLHERQAINRHPSPEFHVQQSEAYYSLQEKYYQEKIDLLIAKLVATEDKLISKEEELAKIQPEMQKLKEETETISILQTQVQLYKVDFHVEQEARKKMQNEKERVCEEIRHLQLHYQKAMESVAQFNSSAKGLRHMQMKGSTQRYSHGPRRAHGGRLSLSPQIAKKPAMLTTNFVSDKLSATSSCTTSESFFGAQVKAPQAKVWADLPSDGRGFPCPKCRMIFSKNLLLMKHVNECLYNADPFIVFHAEENFGCQTIE